jgi:hypothetical protein
MATVVPAVMSNEAGIKKRDQIPFLTKALSDAVKHYSYGKLGKGKGYRGKDAWIFDYVQKKGWDADLENQDALNLTGNIGNKVWRKITQSGLSIFSTTERINRSATIVATVRAKIKDHKGKLTEEDKIKYLEIGKRVAERAHGIYGKENLPTLARGSSIQGQLGRTFYMFKTYAHSLIQLQMELIGEKDYRNAAYLTIAPTLLAGLPSSFAFMAFKALAELIPGIDEPDEIEEDFYNWMGEYGGDLAERVSRSGVVSLFGLDMRGSLAPGEPEFPTTLEDLGGAPYSAAKDVVQGVGKLAQGDVMKSMELILPKFAGNIFKGAREAIDGVSTGNNMPVFYEDQRLRSSLSQTLYRVMGFNPIGLSEKREKQWKETKIRKAYSEIRSNIYDDVRRYLRNGKRPDEWVELMGNIQAYNARVRRNEYTYVPLITGKQLKMTKTRFENPSKRELKRAEGDKFEDQDDLSNFSLDDNSFKSRLNRRKSDRLSR